MSDRLGTTPDARSLPAKRPAGRGSQLTAPQRDEIRSLYVYEGLNISEIAERTGRTRETVATVIRDADTIRMQEEVKQWKRDRAKQTLAGAVDSAAEAWTDTLKIAAKKGDHRPSRDLLLHERVIDPVQQSGGGSVIVNIGIVSKEDILIGVTRRD